MCNRHVWYGLEESFSARKYLQRSLKLYVDNQLVEIPDDINLIQLLSVPTGGDGTDYFRTMQDSIPDELQKFTTPSMGDGARNLTLVCASFNLLCACFTKKFCSACSVAPLVRSENDIFAC